MTRINYWLILANIIFFSESVTAQPVKSDMPIRIGLGYAPGVTTTLDDVFPRFFQRMADVTNKKAQIRIMPLKRAFMQLNKNDIDLVGPYIQNPKITNLERPFYVSSASFWKITFVLYVHKDKEIDINDLSSLKLQTDRGWTDIIGLDVGSVVTLESGMKKVNANRLDGVIYATVVADPLVKRLKLKNIRRIFFNELEVRAAIAKNERVKEIDNMISQSVPLLRESAEFKSFVSAVSKKYEDWQPYKLFAK